MVFVDDNMVNLDDGMEQELKEIKTLVEDNNKILHAMQRRARFASVIRFIYWLVIIGGSIGAFYLIQPYIKQISGVYDEVKQTQQKASDFSQNFSGSIKDLFGGNNSSSK